MKIISIIKFQDHGMNKQEMMQVCGDMIHEISHFTVNCTLGLDIL